MCNSACILCARVNLLQYKKEKNRILWFLANTVAIFTEYTAWVAFGGRKLEVT